MPSHKCSVFGLFSIIFYDFSMIFDVFCCLKFQKQFFYSLPVALDQFWVGLPCMSKGRYPADVFRRWHPPRRFPCYDRCAGYPDSRREHRSSKASGKPYFANQFPKFFSIHPPSFLQ